MAVIVKQKEIAKNITADVYVKIDSVRAGMGENGKITCSCSEWVGTESRAAGEVEYRANISYHIPDENISITSGSLIEAVYPAFKKYFENQGYIVTDDLNNYESELTENLKAKYLAETQKELGSEESL